MPSHFSRAVTPALLLLKCAICRLGLGAWLSEFCHSCGARVRDVWWANPALWHEVAQSGDAGVLCIRCFGEACNARGILIRWLPLVSHRRDAQGEWIETSPPDPELFPVAARLYAEERAS